MNREQAYKFGPPSLDDQSRAAGSSSIDAAVAGGRALEEERVTETCWSLVLVLTALLSARAYLIGEPTERIVEKIPGLLTR